MNAVKLGVHLPIAGRDASPDAIAQVAQEAERLGLDSIWTWERLMRPTVPIALGRPGGPVMPAPEPFGNVYDPIDTLAFVAAKRAGSYWAPACSTRCSRVRSFSRGGWPHSTGSTVGGSWSASGRAGWSRSSSPRACR